MSRFDHIQPDEPTETPASLEEFGFDHYRDLGDQALGRGSFERALRYYGRALERDRQRPEAWLGQIRALLGMGQPEEAASWLEQAAQVLGEVPALLALRALAASRVGKVEDARAWSDRALRGGQDDPEVWLARAEVVYGTGGDKMARVNLEKAHERAPGPAVARRCGEVALSCGDLATARIWLERAGRGEPDNPLVALHLGVYWERAGDLKRAEAELSRALSLEPELESARLALKDMEGRGAGAKLAAFFRRVTRG